MMGEQRPLSGRSGFGAANLILKTRVGPERQDQTFRTTPALGFGSVAKSSILTLGGLIGFTQRWGRAIDRTVLRKVRRPGPYGDGAGLS
jgi:hypothetical protein